MSGNRASYQRASQLTASDLRSVAKSISSQQLSRLSLPQVDAVVDLVSRIIPAGNVPGMILSGLSRLPGRRIPAQKMQQDVNALFSGVEQILDQATYAAFFAGPAAVIWGYQNLLKLAGKEPDAAFPEGVWQFYAGYALREDTARHANETDGFDALLSQHNIRLDAVDRLAAWFMAAVMCLHQYPALLENEWRERVALSLLEEETARAKKLLHQWGERRPYRREEDGAEMDYPTYRRYKFDQFLKENLQSLPAAKYETYQAKLKALTQQDLPAYQRQMSILAYLEPGAYSETRVPIQIADAQVGIIHRESYYLLPACEVGTNKPIDALTVRAQIAALFDTPFASPSQLSALTRVKRSALAGLRGKLNPMLVNDMDNLRFAPILLSSDERSRALPLAELRQAERGVGSHALTIFDTGESFVFDQSHIFFDGAWGSALAEIMTNEALSWARYFSLLPPPVPADRRLYTSLTLQMQPADMNLAQQAPHITPEVCAETDQLDLQACRALRKHFKQRNESIDLTINDLLALYRAIHANQYRPSPRLVAEMDKLALSKPDVAASIRQMIEDGRRVNPSILIPMDASLKTPRERVYPLNLEVPYVELNLLSLHAQTLALLSAYESSTQDRAALYASFDKSLRLYLASLSGLGAVFAKAKEIAIQGESASVGAIKLLAHMPAPLQKLLNQIPERFDLLNNMLKGREVFSNVGAVARSSSLQRFITAKDDNAQKQLAWGVLTDAKGVMKFSLRDFRPHVSALLAIGRKDLANLIAQDYLEGYAQGFNEYARELGRIIAARRETTPFAPTKKRR
ncbi:MAG: hypothetical protein Fur002_00860 [Anaerolineales bacterium]